MKNTRLPGSAAEAFSCEYLQRHGLTLLAKNYRCCFGEVDLIMCHERTWVFIEVRLRNRLDFVTGADSVGMAKQQKLSRTAQHYLQRHGDYYQQACRFDVLDLQRQSGIFRVHWIKNAFDMVV